MNQNIGYVSPLWYHGYFENYVYNSPYLFYQGTFRVNDIWLNPSLALQMLKNTSFSIKTATYFAEGLRPPPHFKNNPPHFQVT